MSNLRHNAEVVMSCDRIERSVKFVYLQIISRRKHSIIIVIGNLCHESIW
jgi:hypothetical protein